MLKFLNCDIRTQVTKNLYLSPESQANIDMVCATERGLINSSSMLGILSLKDNSIMQSELFLVIQRKSKNEI